MRQINCKFYLIIINRYIFKGNWKYNLNERSEIFHNYIKDYEYQSLYDEKFFKEIGQGSIKEIQNMTKNENFHDTDQQLIKESKILDNHKLSKVSFNKMKNSVFLNPIPKYNYLILDKSVHSSELLLKILKDQYSHFKISGRVLEQVFYDKYLI